MSVPKRRRSRSRSQSRSRQRFDSLSDDSLDQNRDILKLFSTINKKSRKIKGTVKLLDYDALKFKESKSSKKFS